MYSVEFLATAVEELDAVPRDDRRKIIAAIDALANDPTPAGVKRLKSPEKFLRLRVGDYRVIYQLDGKQLLVLVVSIGNRRDVYEALDVLTRRVRDWRKERGTRRR